MEDPPEVEELERAADWRLRKLDADPSDDKSTVAADQLRKLAADLRGLAGSALYREYSALCHWLEESDDITAFEQRAHDYRTRIGIDRWAETGEDYLRALIELAKAGM